jgi:hypothetical protein
VLGSNPAPGTTETAEPIITKVFLFPNGMVMVFDQYGEQMPEYQGHYRDVHEKIRAVSNVPFVIGEIIR